MKVKLNVPVTGDRRYEVGEIIETTKESFEYCTRKWPGCMEPVAEEKKPKVADE